MQLIHERRVTQRHKRHGNLKESKLWNDIRNLLKQLQNKETC